MSPEVDLPRTCTLKELAEMAGRSTKVVGKWLRDSGVPLHGATSGRHFFVAHLRARLPEVYDLFEARARKRARGEYVCPYVGRVERPDAA